MPMASGPRRLCGPDHLTASEIGGPTPEAMPMLTLCRPRRRRGRANPRWGGESSTIGSASAELPLRQGPPGGDVRGPGSWVRSVATGSTASGWTARWTPPLLVEHLDVGHARQEEEATRKDASGLDQQPDGSVGTARSLERRRSPQVLGNYERNVGLMQLVGVSRHRCTPPVSAHPRGPDHSGSL